MTRYRRTPRGPQVLRVEGAQQTAIDVNAHNAGTLNFVVDRTIYGHASVKRALGRMQHNRCAYCEVYVKPAQPGHVDHFRPCTAVKQADGLQRLQPGYFWLAYRWDNLFLACFRCNSSFKRDLFPLTQPQLRARAPGQNDAHANPHLIHPVDEEPRDHLRYRGASAYAVNGSLKGRTTRDVFALNRDRNLLNHRQEYLELFKSLVRVAEADPDLAIRAQSEAMVQNHLGGKGQYLAMIRDAFRTMVDGGQVVRLAHLRPQG